MGRTLPYDGIHTQRPTASLVSRKVLSSILGQIVITSATQAWAFFWVRGQPWYEAPPPPIPGEGIEMHNFENTVLFLVSCFQYILVAAVFSIGPPYRKPMWTNGEFHCYWVRKSFNGIFIGWLIVCITALSAFSTWVLFGPSVSVGLILDLVTLPWIGRMAIAIAVLANVGASFAYERWVHEPIAAMVKILWKVSGRRRRRDGAVYESVGHD